LTAREKAEALLQRLPESDMEVVVKFLAKRDRLADIDEWGDLDEMTDAAGADLMADLDEEERAEFGETIGEAWGRERRRQGS
jgi:hypothetical protein